MVMTFDEYIKNPAGKSNSVYSNRDMYRELYRGKLSKLLLRENGLIEYAKYRTSGTYVIHAKIPSETVTKFYYDVVIEFSSVGARLNNAQVRFYSNDPAFCYTFAYTFNKHKMFITELASKMPDSFLKTAAKERNPQDQIGYVKTIYFTYLFMSDRGFFNASAWADAKKLSWKELVKNIESADKKIQARQDEESRIKKQAGIAKRKEGNKKETAKDRTVGAVQDLIRKTPLTGNVGTVGKVKTAKRSNIIKPSLRSKR
jgi:hypothetical protein